MNIQEFHKSFLLKAEGYENLQYHDWHYVEVDYWLNEAIRMFINERFMGYKGKSFESNQKRIEDLRTLLTDKILLPIDFVTVEPASMTHINPRANGYYFELPSNYLIMDEEQAVYTYKGSRTFEGVTECVGDSYAFMVKNPFSEHRLKSGKAKPLRTFIDNVVELITDGNYSIEEYHIRYIRKPQVVDYNSNVSCDLNELVHNEIVEKAITLASARAGDYNKYRISLQEETKNQI